MTNEELKQILEERFVDYATQHQALHTEVQSCLHSLTSLVEQHDRELTFVKWAGKFFAWALGILLAVLGILKATFAAVSNGYDT